ncbi:MAG: DUF692 family protein [Myxococcales bacterium]|nr:DUF692 family protein [Myxococcales bacterium]
MSEAEFLAEIVRRADCGLLLDVNNVYVNARNHDLAEPGEGTRREPSEAPSAARREPEGVAARRRAVSNEADAGGAFGAAGDFPRGLPDSKAFIEALPLERVVQIHLAGHEDQGHVIIDTHGDRMVDPVLDLYAWTIARTGPVSTLIEWDNNIPGIEALVDEVERARGALR